ncbi:MAG: hypothetical protein ACI9MB_002677, partial [Verrucomicrobiales bacterium]
ARCAGRSALEIIVVRGNPTAIDRIKPRNF